VEAHAWFWHSAEKHKLLMEALPDYPLCQHCSFRNGTLQAVDGEGNHVRIVAEYGGGAVVTMDVAIEDHDAADNSFRLHGTSSNDSVVQGTVALSRVSKEMMGAAGQVTGTTTDD
jgi:hypothetical protein